MSAAGVSAKNNRTRRNRNNNALSIAERVRLGLMPMPAVVENTANSRLRHFSANGKELTINWMKSLPTERPMGVVNLPVERPMPFVVEEAPPAPPVVAPILPPLVKTAFDVKALYSKDFGKLDADRDTSSVTINPVGKEYLRRALRSLLKYSKLNFIHFAFYTTYKTSRYNFDIYVFDDYGNSYTIIGDPWGDIAATKFQIYAHPGLRKEPDQDKIIAEQPPLSNSLKSFIKSTIPIDMGQSWWSTVDVFGNEKETKSGFFADKGLAFLMTFSAQIRLLAKQQFDQANELLRFSVSEAKLHETCEETITRLTAENKDLRRALGRA